MDAQCWRSSILHKNMFTFRHDPCWCVFYLTGFLFLQFTRGFNPLRSHRISLVDFLFWCCIIRAYQKLNQRLLADTHGDFPFLFSLMLYSDMRACILLFYFWFLILLLLIKIINKVIKRVHSTSILFQIKISSIIQILDYSVPLNL